MFKGHCCARWSVSMPSILRASIFGSVLLLVVGLPHRAAPAAEPVPARQEPLAVELFPAIEAQQIEVAVVPRDETRLTIRVRNKTDRPLSVRFPDALVAAPILAQLIRRNAANGFNPGANQNPQQNKAPQALGFPMPGSVGNGPGNNQNGPFQGNGNPNGNRNLQQNQNFFNIPPEKVIRIRVTSLCFEYGKRTPSAHAKYELVPLEQFTDKPEIREMLEAFGSGQFTQREGQIAAWHLINDLSWEKLAKLKIEHANGQKENRFAAAEVEKARKMVEQLPTIKERKATKVAAKTSR